MIYEKLFKIQEELEPLRKDKENPFYNSKYADINQILNMIKPVLNKHKILLMQNPVNSDINHIKLETVLIDIEDNTDIKTIISLPFGTNDPQKAGSSITYARRYALKTMFCMEDIDDDGEGHKIVYVNDSEINGLKTASGNMENQILKKLNIKSFKYVPQDKYQQTINYINKLINRGDENA